MQQNIYYIQFALHFANKSINELVASFNREVGAGYRGDRCHVSREVMLSTCKVPLFVLECQRGDGTDNGLGVLITQLST